MKDIEWRNVPGYEDFYQVSNTGLVFSKRMKRNICLVKDQKGYLRCKLYQNGMYKTKKVHRLVLETFVGPSELMVNHIDGIKDNNVLDNLEYVTNYENSLHYWSVINKDNRGPTWVEKSKKYKSQVVWRGEHYYLGLYETKKEAEAAYQAAMRIFLKG